MKAAPSLAGAVALRRQRLARPRVNQVGAADAAAWLPGCLLIIAVSFNGALAIVNGHLFPLTSAAVIAAEVTLVVLSHAIAIRRYVPQMNSWYVLTALLAGFAIWRTIITGDPEPKFFRDVLLIPTFVVLGLASREGDLNRTMLLLHALIFGVLVLEVAAPALYEALFQIKSYYINTRGVVAEDFWNVDSDLYLSATRPVERFIHIFDAPRASSLFLEPVTLGNYCCVATAFLCARIGRLSPLSRLFLFAGIAGMLVGCDGRLATITSVSMVLFCGLVRYVPSRYAIAYLPLATFAAIGLVRGLGLEADGDTFSGRLAYAVNLLGELDLSSWLGLSSAYYFAAMDSGLVYLIVSQSLVGTLLIWSWVTLAARDDRIDQRSYAHLTAFFISLTALVSYSIVSIKTAAPMWFIYGALQRAPVARLPPIVAARSGGLGR
jgi:putative polymerase